tara:strand:+ start:229 stop:525 length:297 start_codon:yes stop_codon:yes gene_type:complete
MGSDEMSDKIGYKFECEGVLHLHNKKDNPDFPCDITLRETVYQMTEVFPLRKKDDNEYYLEYGNSDYIDSDSDGYYCNNCNTQFTFKEVVKLIVEEEE